MRDPDPIGADVRNAQARRWLADDAACVQCGRQNTRVLKKRKRGILEQHHPAGVENDADLTVVLCLNCHRENTDVQYDLGVDLSHDRRASMPEQLVSVLRGLAAFFALLAQRLIAWADALAALVARFDRDCPQWREWQEAQT